MNIDQIRKDTLHCSDKIFLNSAGASLMPKIVSESVKAYWDKEERLGGYKVSDTHQAEIAKFYQAAANLIGANPENIAFAHDATDAYAKALSAISFEKGDVLITSEDDYTSNQIQFLSLQNRFGIAIQRIKTLTSGDMDIAHFQELVRKHSPKLVAITHVPTNSGLVQDVAAIGEICAKEEIIFLVDACQSVGQFPVDVQQIKCDFLTATGRKFLRGPRGTGFFICSDRLLTKGYAPLFIDGGGATWTDINEFEALPNAQRFQMWEKPYALIIGLTKAMEYAQEIGMENILHHNQQLMQQLRANLATISGVHVFDKGTLTCNLLTFRKEGKSQEKIQKVLDQQAVFYSVSTKEWGIIDYGKKGWIGTIRLSPHYFNTLAEMDEVAGIIADI